MKIPIIIILVTTVALLSCDTKRQDSEDHTGQATKEPKPKQDITYIVNIKAIAGKKPEEVAAVLGPPTQTSETKYGPKQVFESSNIDIVYINGLSDWITVNDMKGVSYSDEAIQYLGLPDNRPTFSNQHVKRWKNIPGFLEVSIFPGENGKIFYAYVKTKEE